jgi:parvulin-like peptidyl-prolyl isomerase
MSLIRMKYRMRRAIRPFLLAFAVLFFISCFTLYGSYRFTSAEEQYIAEVNGEKVPRADYEAARQQLLGMLRRNQGSLGMEWFANGYALQGVIGEFLHKQAAEKMGISVSRREAEDARDAEIDAQLKEIGQGMSGTELEQERALLQARSEYSIEKRLRQMLSQRLDEKLKEKARPVEVRASQILIKADKRTPEQALELARKAQDKAGVPGTDFAAVARSMSEDDATKSKGGDLDWINADSGRPPEVVATALQLKKGQVSAPIATDDGYVVLKATDERNFVSAKKDAKEQKEDIDAYRDKVGQAISRGFQAGLRRERDVRALTPYFEGLLAEQDIGPGGRFTEASVQGKARLQAAVKAYEKVKGPEAQKPDFAYHLGQLYVKMERYPEAEKEFRLVLENLSAAEVHMALGEVLEKLAAQAGQRKNPDEAKKRKGDAVAQYQEASKNAFDQPGIHGQLAQRFKSLGRPDLAALEEALNKKYLAEMLAQQKRTAAAREKIQRRLKVSPSKSGTAGGGAAGLPPGTAAAGGGAGQPISIKVPPRGTAVPGTARTPPPPPGSAGSGKERLPRTP